MRQIWLVTTLSFLVFGWCVGDADDINELFRTIVHYEEIETVKPLLQRVGPNARDEFGTPLFFHAIERGGREAVDLFFEQNVDINQRDDRNRTALMVAAQWGNITALRALLARGALLFECDKAEHTVFDIAILYGRSVIVEELVEQWRDMLCVAADRVRWCSPQTREIISH